MSEKRVFTLEFKTAGIGEIKNAFKTLSDLVPDKEIKKALDDASKSIEDFIRGRRGGATTDFLGADKLKGDIVQVAEFIQEKFGAPIENSFIKELEVEIGELQKKIDEATSKRTGSQQELEEERKGLEKLLQSSEFGEVLSKNLTTAAAVKERIRELEKEVASPKTKESKSAAEKELKAIEKLKPELDEFIKIRQRLNAQQMGFTRGIDSNTKKQIKLKEELSKARKDEVKKIEEIAKEMGGEGEQAQLLTGILELLYGVVDRVDYESQVDAHKKAAKAKKEEAKTVKELKKEEEDLKEIQDKGEKSMAKKLVTGLSYYTVFNQIKRILKDSIRAITELDSAMTKAAIVTNMTRKESWQLLKTYQNLAQETGKTTSEIANLNAFFLQQGKTVKQAMEMTEAAAKSAAVAGTSLQEAANYITSAIHGFGLAASEAESVADKFAALGASTASSFEEIAIAMSKVAPVAQSAGLGIDFMMGILAKGIHTTREAPEAIGTAMKTIFARMRELTDIGKATEDGMSLNRVERAVNSIGVNLRDVTGQFRNLEDVLTDVGMKWHTLDSMEQAYLATALAGTRQQPRLLAILNDFETTMEMIETSREAEDELMYQHMDYLESMEAATNKLKNSWEQTVTTLVQSDVVIKGLQIATYFLEKLGGMLKFVADRTWLMVPILGLITILTLNLAHAKLKQWRAALKLNKEEHKGFLRTFINNKKQLYQENLKNLQKKKSIATIKASGIAINAETAATGGQIAAGTTEAGVTKLQTAANYGKAASLWAVLWPMLALAAAVAAVVAIGYVFVKAFQHATRTANDFGKEIDKSNKKIHESKKKVKEIKDLREEYLELEKQVHKTNEELDRMSELLNDLESYNDGTDDWNFVKTNLDGSRELDESKIREFQRREAGKQLKEQINIRETAHESIAVLGKEALKNKSIRKAFRGYGDDIANGMADKITDSGFKHKFLKGMQRVINRIDISDDSFYGEREVVGPDGYTYMETYFKEDIYEDRISNIGKELKTQIGLFEDIYSLELDSTEELQKQLELIESSNLNHEETKEALKEIYPDLYKLYSIMEELDISAEDFSQTLTDLANRGISIDIYLEVRSKLGTGIDFGEATSGKDFLENYKDQIEEAEDIRKEIEEKERSLELYEAAGKPWWRRQKTWENIIAERDDEIEALYEDLELAELKLPEVIDEDEIDFMIKWQEAGFDNFIEGLARGKIDDDDLSDLILDMKQFYIDEMEMTPKEAETAAKAIYAPFIKAPEDAAQKIKENQSLIMDSLKIKDEIKQGDFSNYLKLVETVGYEAADAFLKTGDISKIQEEMLKRQKNELNMAIIELESLATTRELNDVEKARLETLKFMHTNLDNLVDKEAIWNNELKKTEAYMNRIKKTSDFLDKLGDLEIDIDIKDSLLKSIQSLNDMAIDELERDIESAYFEREAAWKALEDENLIKDGKIISTDDLDKKELIDNFYKTNDYFVDSAENAISLIEDQINRHKKAKEKEIKVLEDSHKERMDLLKKQHDERWKAIDHESKILDLQEKVIAARNKLAATMFGGDSTGQKDATKALKEAREARQKEIEAQILDRIQKEEEARKDEEIKAIQEGIEAYTKETSENLTELLEKFDGNVLNVKVTNEPEPESTSESATRGRSMGGGGLLAILDY